MKISRTNIFDILILEINAFGDERGWFAETYRSSVFYEIGLNLNFVQDNHSFSLEKGTLRGLHYQKSPMAQTKLVRCTRGAIFDVAVDLRKNSPTFAKWVGVKLSADNKKQLLVPKGFAHGFLTLTDNVEVQYKVDEVYSHEHDRGIRFDDPTIGVNWPIDGTFVLSEKDKKAPFFDLSKKYF